jgi:hypothetical protein
MLYKKINVELIVVADEADAVVAKLNAGRYVWPITHQNPTQKEIHHDWNRTDRAGSL